MGIKVFDEKAMAEYLLGLLSDEEREQMEESFFQDDSQFEQLSAFENDLIDSYVRGRLSTRLRKAFEEKLKTDPGWKQRVVFAQALSRRIASQQSSPRTTAQPASLWQSLIDAFRNQRPVFQLAAVAGSLLIIVGVSWMAWQVQEQRRALLALQVERNSLRESMQSMETQIAELRNRDVDLSSELEQERARRQEIETQQQPSANPLGLVASFVLRSGTVRAASDSPRIVIPRAARTVRLQLDLDTIDEYRSYRTEIRTTRGDVVWSGDGLRARRTDAGQALILELPAPFLNPGEYEIALSGLNDGRLEEVGFYYFNVPER